MDIPSDPSVVPSDPSDPSVLSDPSVVPLVPLGIECRMNVYVDSDIIP